MRNFVFSEIKIDHNLCWFFDVEQVFFNFPYNLCKAYHNFVEARLFEGSSLKFHLAHGLMKTFTSVLIAEARKPSRETHSTNGSHFWRAVLCHWALGVNQLAQRINEVATNRSRAFLEINHNLNPREFLVPAIQYSPRSLTLPLN